MTLWMVVDAEFRIWPMPEILMIIINLNARYREFASGFRSSSSADSCTWALGVIIRTICY